MAGARKSHCPTASAPQLAQLVSTPPSGEKWLHEIKFDGYRMFCRKDGPKARFISRNNQDWTNRVKWLAKAALDLPCKTALLDGEIAVLEPHGVSSFGALQDALSRGGRNIVYFAFDLLYLDGYDLRSVPLELRKDMLDGLLHGFDGPFTFISSFDGDGQAVFDEACRLGAEGIVSKRKGSPYRAGRTGAWLKAKCLQQGEFIVGGYTETTSPGEAFGALLVGEYAEDGRFHYVGRVGTGFSDKLRRELFQRLRQMEIDKCPFKARPRTERRAHWVKPQMRVIARFTERTSDNKLRHPSYQGLAQKQS